MVLGSIWCPLDQTRAIIDDIRGLKSQFGLPAQFEIKWTKVSPAKLAFYQALIDYFYDNEFLHFRALVVPDKTILRHHEFEQTHDDWYYKMYFDMLKVILSPSDCYRIYLDIKDTRGGMKVRKLHEVLSNSMYDFRQEIIQRVQIIRSHEVEILQLADLMIGAVSTINRGEPQSPAKQVIIHQIQNRSKYSLVKTTLLREMKTNIFVWHPREVV
jgi:hypothetical protein